MDLKSQSSRQPDAAAATTAKSSPQTVFDHPIEVLTDKSLTDPEKSAVLEQWAADEIALQVADDEGMAGGSPTALDHVNAARSLLPSQATETPPSFSGRVFRPDEFFTGAFSGSGVVLTRFGGLLRQFILDGTGTVDPATGILLLTETYRFDDGQIDELNWIIRRNDDGSYDGSETSLADPAEGKTTDNSFVWTYVRHVPDQGGETTTMSFHDTFWLQADGSSVAHASIRRLGIEVATMSVFYIKK